MTHTFPVNVMVAGVPEIVRYLRAQICPAPGKRTREDGIDRGVVQGMGPRLPLNVDALDASDLLVESTAYWCEALKLGTHGIGRCWRYHPDHPDAAGEVRGLINDDMTPVYALTDRLMNALEQPHFQPPEGMARHFQSVLAPISTFWPQVSLMLVERRKRAT